MPDTTQVHGQTMPGLASSELPTAGELTSRFRLERNPNPADDVRYAEVMSALRFGAAFTDHMARAEWTPHKGWHDQRVEAYGPLTMDPASSVLHYGQEAFEGLKAYRWDDGSVWSFRPGYNAARLAVSARRMALPELPALDVIGSLAALVAADERWVPNSEGSSLYLRPFMFSCEPFLGVRAGHLVKYLVIASPVGPYFPHGFTPVSIFVTRDYHRTGPGGTGEAKTGGNYASSLLPQQQAFDKGFDQVMFVDSATKQYMEELGGMNVVVVNDDGTVRTPNLGGTILRGGTRDSILTLLRDKGYEVREEPIHMGELFTDIKSGKVREMFACGTAAVVTAIGRLADDDEDLTVADGQPGELTRTLHQELTDIQNGRRPDPYDWMYRLV